MPSTRWRSQRMILAFWLLNVVFGVCSGIQDFLLIHYARLGLAPISVHQRFF
jgi:hypothetical protein